MGLDLRAELEWAREFSRANPKNYQVWHHRQCLISLVGEESGELAEMIGDFQQEPKNYHAWQYRQWLVGRFHADEAGELRLVDELIRIDPYNNSAYNHRYFVLFGTGRRGGRSEAWWAEELCWAEAKLGLDASNPSAQLYLEAIQALRQQKLEAVDA